MSIELNMINNRFTDELLEKDLLGLLFREMGWSFLRKPTSYRGKCFRPDCDGNLVVYTNGDTLRINWKCYGSGCHDQYKESLLGLVRAYLSVQIDDDCTFKKTISYLGEFIRDHRNSSNPPPIGLTTPISVDEGPPFKPCSRQKVRRLLEIPSPYFVETGKFSRSVLESFDVGHSDKLNSEVCPLYDHDGNLCIAYMERTNSPLCEQCGRYHEDSVECWEAIVSRSSKWKSSAGQRPRGYLYGYHLARKSNRPGVLVVPGAPDVWRAHEAGKCAVALLGWTLSKDQLANLLSLERMIVLALDNDARGKDATRVIAAMLARRAVDFRLAIIPPGFKDIGELPRHRFGEIKVVRPGEA